VYELLRLDIFIFIMIWFIDNKQSIFDD